MARRRRQGHTQYLVKWRGYPHSQNSWEFEVPLRQDCPDVVDSYDRDHPVTNRPTESPGATRFPLLEWGDDRAVNSKSRRQGCLVARETLSRCTSFGLTFREVEAQAPL
ncbi:hypothetical protein F444_18417 [Phytophthora nicotianae P1976]|uniref:Chromo domain-containing protein n=1 Tax=Phytophthora nicotianae P1976 TaxID=1317066 RepID=A0A080ZBE3_PHYNI|nr:hypothetical protein F444_18417 [Phytophthora nicotianae P1976]